MKDQAIYKELEPRVFIVENFLSKKECEHWIQFSEKTGYEPAAINRGNEQVVNRVIRNNERIIYDNKALAQQLWERLKSYVTKEYGNTEACGLNERLRFYKYQPGHRFKQHKDGIFRRNIDEASQFTFMIYLNENMKGGATKFIDYEVQPKTGMALVFPHHLLHEGVAVEEGIKYVLRTDVMYRRKSFKR